MLDTRVWDKCSFEHLMDFQIVLTYVAVCGLLLLSVPCVLQDNTCQNA